MTHEEEEEEDDDDGDDEKNKIHLAVCKKTLSPAKHVLEGTSHQTRPNIDAGDAFLLMRSIH
jgi:hypothetical protein